MNHIIKTSHIVKTDEGPRSSCCGLEVKVRKDYTDTHVYVVDECETDENGNVIAATYKFVRTYDGLDGENFRAYCENCDADITDDIELEEG